MEFMQMSLTPFNRVMLPFLRLRVVWTLAILCFFTSIVVSALIEKETRKYAGTQGFASLLAYREVGKDKGPEFKKALDSHASQLQVVSNSLHSNFLVELNLGRLVSGPDFHEAVKDLLERASSTKTDKKSKGQLDLSAVQFSLAYNELKDISFEVAPYDGFLTDEYIDAWTEALTEFKKVADAADQTGQLSLEKAEELCLRSREASILWLYAFPTLERTQPKSMRVEYWDSLLTAITAVEKAKTNGSEFETYELNMCKRMLVFRKLVDDKPEEALKTLFAWNSTETKEEAYRTYKNAATAEIGK